MISGVFFVGAMLGAIIGIVFVGILICGPWGWLAACLAIVIVTWAFPWEVVRERRLRKASGL